VPRKDKFVNPLTHPSTEPETLPATDTSTLPSTFTPTPKRRRGDMAFEKTHERITLWLQKSYKRQFEALAEKEGVAKSTLLDEAIRDLIEKYNAWDL
jgi:hypothetical protein